MAKRFFKKTVWSKKIFVAFLLFALAFEVGAVENVGLPARVSTRSFFAQVLDGASDLWRSLFSRSSIRSGDLDGNAIREKNRATSAPPPPTSNSSITIRGNLTAPNVVYEVVPGDGISIIGGQRPVISQTLWALSGTSIISQNPVLSLNIGSNLSVGGAISIGADLNLGSAEGARLSFLGPARETYASTSSIILPDNLVRALSISASSTQNLFNIGTVGSGSISIGTDSRTSMLNVATDGTRPAFEVRGVSTGPYLLVDERGRVGIGTSAASTSILAIQGATLITGTTTVRGNLNVSSSTYLATDGGRVGVGTQNPGELLTIQGTLGVSGRARFAISPLLTSLVGCTGESVLETNAEGEITCGVDEKGSSSSSGGRGVVNSGESGQVAYYGSGGRTVDPIGNLYFDDSTIRLGIGTSSPATTTSIAGALYLTRGLGVGIATGTPGVVQTTGVINVGGTGTSTFANGIVLTTGCVLLPDGNCAGAGSGTITSGTANRLTYYSSATVLDSASHLTVLNSTLFGVGTTVPQAILAVQGSFLVSGTTTLDSNVINIASSTATSTTIRYFASSTSTIPANVFNTWNFATSSESRSILSVGSSVGLPRIGVGTSTPYAFFSIEGLPGQAQFVVGSSSLTNFIVDSKGQIGIGTSTPGAFFSIGGAGAGTSTIIDLPNIYIGSTSATALTLRYQAASTSTIPNSKSYAWTIATTTSAQPFIAINSNNSFGTTTITGGFAITPGLSSPTNEFEYDYSSNITKISNLELGSSHFDADSGIVTWVDMVVATTAGRGTTSIQSYTARIDGNPLLTIYGASDSYGGVATTSVAIGTSTGAYLLHVASTSPFFAITDTNAATNFKHWTISNQNGNLYFATSSDLYATSSIPIITASSSGAVGISSSSPYAWLSVQALPGIPQFAIGSTTGTNFIVDSTGYIGIGTNTPRALFSLAGFGDATSTIIDLPNIYIGSSSARELTVRYQARATTTIPNTTTYAWTIATTTANSAPILAITTNAPRASTTITGSFVVDGGAFAYDANSGTTSIDLLQLGPTAFDTDAGKISWIDLPVSTTSPVIDMGYTAQIDANPVLTIFGRTDGSGGVVSSSTAVGIGTTTPAFLLQVASTSPFIGITDTDAATNLKHWTISNQGGNLYFSTSSDLYHGGSTNLYATSSVPIITASSSGAVGISSSSPYAWLSVQALPGTPQFAVGSTSGTNLIVDSSGFVGVATTVPRSPFSVIGNTYLDSGLITLASSSARALTVSYEASATSTVLNNTVNVWSIATSTTVAPVFSIDTTNGGRVAVGTTSPTNVFEVAGKSAAFNTNRDASFGSWTTNTNSLVVGITGNIAAAANGYIYSIGGAVGASGGAATTTIYYAKVLSDGSTGQWLLASSSIPIARAFIYGAPTVVANGYIYVVGGRSGSAASATDNRVFYTKVYGDGTLGPWNEAPNLPANRKNVNPVAYNGFIYLAGGATETNTPQTTVYYARMNADGSLGAWNTTTVLTEARWTHSTLVINGYLYVIGGHDGTSYEDSVLYAKINSNGTLGAWATTTVLPVIRGDSGAVAANGYIYSVGGENLADGVVSSIVYAPVNADGTVGRWTTSSVSLPAVRQTFGIVTVNGYIYAIGGDTNSSTADNGVTTVYYTSLPRVRINGNLDLLGLASTSIQNDGSEVGGSIFAGNIFSANNIEASGRGQFWQGLSVQGPVTFNVATGTVQTSVFSIDNTTAYSTATSSLFSVSGRGFVGIGTSTPQWGLQIASNTAAFLTLTAKNAATNFKHWTISNQNGNLYFATSSDLYATSSVSIITASSSGAVGISSSSPYAWLSVQALPGIPQFAIGSTTGTNFIVDSTGYIGIGTSTPGSFLSVSGTTTIAYATSTALAQNGLLNIQGNSIGTPALVYGRRFTDDYMTTRATSTATSTFFLRYDDTRNLGLGTSYGPGYGTSSLLFGVDTRGALTINHGTSSAVKMSSFAIGATSQAIVVSGRYAYVVDSGSDDLKVIDISNPSAPTQAGSLSLGSVPVSVFVSGRYAYVVDQAGGDLKVIDISNPSAPNTVGSRTMGSAPRSVFVSGRYAYVVDPDSTDLKVIDISNPSAPNTVGSRTVGSLPRSVFVSGRYAYVVDSGSDDLKVIDISNPSAPTQAGSLSLGIDPVSVFVSGRYAYVVNQGSDDLKVIDISNPSAPTLVGRFAFTDTTGNTPVSVFVSGRYAYVVDSGSDDLKIIDISGAEVNALMAHSLEAGSLSVRESAQVQGDLSVTSGLTVGSRGGLFGGPVSINSPATTTLATNVSLLSLTHATGTFVGTGLLMDFATSTYRVGTSLPSGTFTGNFIHFLNASTTRFIATAQGLFGISTSSPLARLSIDAASGTSTLVIGSSTESTLLVTSGGTLEVGTSSASGGVAFQHDIKVFNGSICADNNGTVKCQSSPLTAGSIYADAFPTTPADIGENYPVMDESIESGDIVMVHSLSAEELTKKQDELQYLKGKYKDETPTSLIESSRIGVKKADLVGRDKILGVVSPRPGVLLGDITGYSTRSTYKPVALSGRIPVKVSTENGAIKSGDRITISSLAGVGMKAGNSGVNIGLALDDLDVASATTTAVVDGKEVKIGKVMVFVNLGYSRLDEGVVKLASGETNAWSVNQQSGKVNVGFYGDIDLHGNSVLGAGKILSENGKWRIDENGVVFAEEIQAKRGSFEESLEIGKKEKPTGITIYDTETKEPYCIRIANGAILPKPGKCGSPLEGDTGPEPSLSNPSSKEVSPIIPSLDETTIDKALPDETFVSEEVPESPPSSVGGLEDGDGKVVLPLDNTGKGSEILP